MVARRRIATFGGLLAAALIFTTPAAPTIAQATAAGFGAISAAATLWPAVGPMADTGVPRPLLWAATTSAMTATALTLVLIANLTQEYLL